MADASLGWSLETTQDEIDDRRATINSLDVNKEFDAQEKARLEQELNHLESLLEQKEAEERTRQYQEDLKFLEDSETGKVPESLTTSPAAHQQWLHSSFSDPPLPTGFSAYSGSQIPFGRHFASDGVSGGQNMESLLHPWNHGSGGDLSTHKADAQNFLAPDVEPSSASTSASGSSPDQDSSIPSPALHITSDNPKKRQRESFSLPGMSTGHVAKAMRATPSPAITGPTTPSSIDSFELPEDSEFFRLMGGNPKEDLREMREEQKAHERMLQEKKEQERRDEEFARQLMEQDMDSSSPPRSQPWGTPPVEPRSISQTAVESKRFNRPESKKLHLSSPLVDQPHFHRPNNWPIKQESATYSSSSKPSTQGSQHHSTVPSASTVDFIDLGSDEEYDDVAGDASGDLFEIQSQRQLPWTKKYEMVDNNAAANPRVPGMYQDFSTGASPFRNVKSEASSSHSYNTYPVGIGYSGSNAYNSAADVTQGSSWSNMAGQVGHTISGAAKGVYNAASSLLDNHIGSLRGPAPGYGNSPYGYGLAGSSSNPYLVSEFEFDYQGQPSHTILDNVLRNNSINANDPKNRELVDRYKDRVHYLTNDPTRTSSEIKSLLENIRPDEDLPAENREGTPDAMTYPLMEHQKLGLAWMKNMEEGSNKGGILADDMGLGKTIQALALLVSRKSQDPRCKTTLIVAPVALMKQWEREIEQKLKPGRENRLTHFTLHGTNRQASWEHLRTFDVVLTTFGTLANEVKRKDGIDFAKRANPNWRAITKADRLPLLGDECKWFRVIIDEAQCIKNKNTKAALGALALQSLTRFCMSGTPMMNNVGELFSLIQFLRIKPYNIAENFTRDFTRPLKNSNEPDKDKAMQKLQALLKAILLRRTKKSKIDGKPILTLPERTTEHQHAVFSDDEQAFYRALESKTQLQFNKYLKAGTVGRNYSNVLVLLLRLRQACCHPHLIKDHGMSSGVADISAEDMIKLARDLAPDVVARIKEKGGMNEQSALECPICMDMAENATIFIPCGHSTCSECFAKISDPSQAIAGGDAAEGRNVDIKCPNCRGKVVPSKVIDHNTFKEVYMPENVDLAADPQADIETTDESDSDSEDDSDDSDSLKDFIVADDEVSDATESDDDDNAAEGYRKGKTPFEKSASQAKKSLAKKKKARKGKGVATEKKTRKTLAQLKKESRSSTKARKAYLKRLALEWETSGKIEKVLEILQAIQDREEGEKTIIFSQFTSLLDLLEVPIDRNHWGYKRYDGSMSSNARNEAVIDFSDKPDCKIMLVSLKAGNSGLNLVAASQVIILDPFWNPYIEEQAIDRAHRIGQMRPVQVHRILVPDTVEDRILALQEKKRALIEGALDEKASQDIGRLGTRELAFLFVSYLSEFNSTVALICVHRAYPLTELSNNFTFVEGPVAYQNNIFQISILQFYSIRLILVSSTALVS